MSNNVLKAYCIIVGVGFLLLRAELLAVEGVVKNRDGRSFEGDLKVLNSESLSLDLNSDGGTVSYIFNKEDLTDITFLDLERVEEGLDAFEQGHHPTAIRLLEDIHRHRSPFFKLFPNPSLAEPSLALGTAYLKTHQYANATGVAGVLLGSGFSNAFLQAKANELLLLAFFGMKRWDEAELLARRWCEIHEPSDETALGWWILSEVHLARKEFEKARWVSLQPITFSSQFPKAYLQECYHVAIASCVEDTPELALRLYKEYQERGYSWPQDGHLEAKMRIVKLTKIDLSDQEEDSEPLTLDEGVPKKDLNLPLETVRKLTTKKEPSSTP